MCNLRRHGATAKHIAHAHAPTTSASITLSQTLARAALRALRAPDPQVVICEPGWNMKNRDVAVLSLETAHGPR